MGEVLASNNHCRLVHHVAHYEIVRSITQVENPAAPVKSACGRAEVKKLCDRLLLKVSVQIGL